MGLETFRNTEGAVLIDVRSVREFKLGHIPGSKNLPLQEIEKAKETIPDTDTPVFVYCFSGARSEEAVELLKGMGYSRAMNIGGIRDYYGETKR